MSTKPKIEDAGEKLGGARKDMATPTGTAGEGVHQEALLELLWPKPERWTDLIPSLGPHRAALVMVTYENLAKKPPPSRMAWFRWGALGTCLPFWHPASAWCAAATGKTRSE